MANTYNYGLYGVSPDLQLGKAGPRLKHSSGTFNLKAVDGSTDAALTAAGIISSSGNVALTTGNLVLTAAGAKATIGGTDVLQLFAANVPQISGSAAVLLPTGNTAARPTASTGMVRLNNDAPATTTLEFYNGTTWMTVATGGDATALQNEVNSIEASLGSMVSNVGVWNNAALTNTTIYGTTPADLTVALNNLATYVDGHNTLEELLAPGTAGNVIYSNGANWVTGAPGATSGVQGYDAGLAALAVKTSTGILVQTGNDTFTSVTITAPAAGITITNGNGVAGAPTLALANDLAGVEGLSTTGYAIRTGDGTWQTGSIAGTASNISVSNGDGVSAGTTINLATVTNPGNGGSFVKITTDTYGRVTNSVAVGTSDITGLVDSTYVNVSGDTMASNASLTFVGTGTVTGLPAPTADTDAANKAYVDSVAAGLTWKNAVAAATDAALTSTYANGTAGVGATLTNAGTQTLTFVIDGVTLSVGNRVLVKNQSTLAENGIYTVTNIGSTSTNWILTRASDQDQITEFQNASVFVSNGTVGHDTGWTETLAVATVGTSDVTWVQFSGANAYTWGTGLTISGNTVNVNLGAGIAQLPTDEVGVDLYNTTTGAIILTTNGTSRDVAGGGFPTTAAALHLLLDTTATGGLDQGSAGLFIKSGGVTNTMIVNNHIHISGDSGTVQQLNLGEELTITGDAAQGVSTATQTGTGTGGVDITVANATTTTKGVASFNSTSFTATSGAITLNTVGATYGGTGYATTTTGDLLVGAAGNTWNKLATANTSTLVTSAAGTASWASGATANRVLRTDGTTVSFSQVVLTTDVTGTLPVGNGGTGADTFASTQLLYGNGTSAIGSASTLTYNGTSLVVGGITANGTTRTLTGSTSLDVAATTGAITLTTTNGNIVVSFGAASSNVLTVAGLSAAAYSANVVTTGDLAIPNKKYVDDQIASVIAAGDVIKSMTVTVPLDTNGVTNLPATFPAGSTILRTRLNVTIADTAATVVVGVTGTTNKYMKDTENNPQVIGLYIADTYIDEGSAIQGFATVASTAGTSGATCTLFVEYKI
jgi:hypothetical protein